MRGRRTYQQHDGNVEEEGNEGIGDESRDTKSVDIGHGHAGDFSEERHDTVEEGAGGRIVVERDHRVHLEFGGAEKTLDHHETQRLEDDTTDLDYMLLVDRPTCTSLNRTYRGSRTCQT